MSKRTYEEYIKNGCHPVGYNEPCQSYYFGQVSVDWLLDQLDQANERLKGAIVPKFERDDYVYALFTQTEIYKGQICAFDYYTDSYLIYSDEDIGSEWIKADRVFKTKSEAEKKRQELRGGE